MTVADLAAARSTWNGTDLASREILAPWGHTWRSGEGNARGILDVRAEPSCHCCGTRARPRAGLYEKALGSYSEPAVPEPIGWAFESVARRRAMRPIRDGLLPPTMTDMRSNRCQSGGSSSGRPLELIFNTETAPWRGDLGAFLRDQDHAGDDVRPGAGAGVGAASLHSGQAAARASSSRSGSSRTFAGRAPGWSPAEGATERRSSSFKEARWCITNLVVRHEATARLEHLIHVEDGHLVLSQCQLLAPASLLTPRETLIAFRSVTTQPRPVNLDEPLFSFRSIARCAGCRLRSDHRVAVRSGGAGARAGRTFATVPWPPEGRRSN